MSFKYNKSPYKIIPEELQNDFTMYGSIPIYDWYRDDSVTQDIEWSNSLINDNTSLFGLLQFSIDKVYNVKNLIFNLTQCLTIFFTALTPNLCPSTLLKFLFFAHLPLPSIIMAK